MSAFLSTKTTGFMKILFWKVSPPCVAHIYNQITHRFHKLTCMAQVLWHLKFCSQVFTYVNSVWLNQLFRFLTSCIILKCSTADKKTTWFNNCITDRGHVCWRGSTVSSGTKHRHVATCINDLEILWYKRWRSTLCTCGKVAETSFRQGYLQSTKTTERRDDFTEKVKRLFRLIGSTHQGKQHKSVWVLCNQYDQFS